MIDLTAATAELARVVAAVREDQLPLPTPCEGWSVADLLDHVGGLAVGFAGAVGKDRSVADEAPEPDGANLADGWRTRVGSRLDLLAEAWRDPAAWEGHTSIAGVETTAAENAATALDEVVVHTWDLARATGQECALDPTAVEAALGFARAVSEQAPDGVPGLVGPAGDVPPGADRLTELLVRTGRDPRWAATAG